MIRRATDRDAEALTGIINRAFAVEKFFIDADRITLDQVREFLDKGAFFVAQDDQIQACIYVELRGERAYFGLLSVEPAYQRSGLGKQLIAFAENFAREAGCRFMDINVIDLRTELPPIYRKLGYSVSGTSPLPDSIPTKLPCHFIQMTKPLS
ncbi:MAG TPA: GNAT family N-acetyltransferase [Bryobacteraceae bacterium]|nr:GNAT family N-acetyltransferase [Bryobacteraceae bacterium]